jgi:hypothetical protein
MPRIALYRPWTGSADEGWTRWLLETYDIPFASLLPDSVTGVDLSANFDVILIPSVETVLLTGGMADRLPPGYAGFLGAREEAALRGFVETGGNLVAFGAASSYVIDLLDLTVSDRLNSHIATKGSRFFPSGSIFGVIVEENSAISSGLPENISVFSDGLSVFDVGGNAEAIARFANEPLLSGYVADPQTLAGGAALVVAPVGLGHAILFAFRPQHRGQTYGTFKAVFNALLLGELL